jgi:hypothetical protein
MEIDTRLSATILIKRELGKTERGEDNKCLLVGKLMMLKMNSLRASPSARGRGGDSPPQDAALL